MSKNRNLSGGLFTSSKPTTLTIKETPLSAQIAEYLSNRNLWNERLNAGKIETKNGNWIHLCERGTPDRITIIRGQAIFIEAKMFGKKATSEQLKKHDELRASGAIVIVADSYKQFTDEFSAVCSEIIKAQSMENRIYD